MLLNDLEVDRSFWSVIAKFLIHITHGQSLSPLPLLTSCVNRASDLNSLQS